MWPPGSKTDHLSLCGGVTTGPLRHCHRFCFHYNFIIGTSWVRGCARRLSRLAPPVGAGVRPLRAEPHLWYIPPVSPLHRVTLLKPRQGQYDEALCLSGGGGKYFTGKASPSWAQVSHPPLLSRNLGGKLLCDAHEAPTTVLLVTKLCEFHTRKA